MPDIVEEDNRLALVYEAEYLWPPVSIEQFVDDDYYLGTILRGNIFETNFAPI